MKSRRPRGWASRTRTLIPPAILLATISGLDAGRGNLGPPLSNVCCSTVSVVADGTLFSETIVSGDSTTSLRNRLVATIDAHPSFSATSYVDPLDPNDVSFEVTRQTGARLSSIHICENGGKIETLGVGAAIPKNTLTLAKASSVSGLDSDSNPSTHPTYALTIRLSAMPAYSMTYDTSLAPNNTAPGLNNSVKTDLIAAGFSVSDDSVSLTLTRAGTLFDGVKQITTDTGMVQFCGGVTTSSSGGGGAPPQGVPTLSETGMTVLVLILAMTGAAFLRRRMRGEGGSSR